MRPLRYYLREVALFLAALLVLAALALLGAVFARAFYLLVIS